MADRVHNASSNLTTGKWLDLVRRKELWTKVCRVLIKYNGSTIHLNSDMVRYYIESLDPDTANNTYTDIDIENFFPTKA